MKKISKEALYLIATFADGLSGAMMIKAAFGNTPMGAFPLVLNEIFTSLTPGMMNFIVQIIVLFILMFILKKFTTYYLMSFIAAFLYDAALDICLIFLRNTVLNLSGRIIFYIIAIILVAFACGAYMYTSMPLMPFDVIVRDLAYKFKKENGNVKLFVDCFFLASAIVLSLIVFKEVKHVGIGTIIVSFANGLLISAYDRTLFNRFEYTMKTKAGQFLEKLKPF